LKGISRNIDRAYASPWIVWTSPLDLIISLLLLVKWITKHEVRTDQREGAKVEYSGRGQITRHGHKAGTRQLMPAFLGLPPMAFKPMDDRF
jgi:hypothetical protein